MIDIIESKLKSVENQLKSIESKLNSIENQLKSIEINWNQLKINWNQLKSIEHQLKVNWNQLNINWNQLKSIEHQLKPIEHQLTSIEINWSHIIQYLVLKKIQPKAGPKIVWGGPTLNHPKASWCQGFFKKRQFFHVLPLLPPPQMWNTHASPVLSTKVTASPAPPMPGSSP